MGGLAGDVTLYATAVAAAGGAAMLARRGARSTLDLGRRLVHLIDDVAGEPAHGDQPERPGLMKRIGNIESRLTAVEAVVLKELTHNGGSSIKDQVAQVAGKR